MSVPKVEVNVPRDDSGFPGIVGELGRVTVVLGTNGSGKSKLLHNLVADRESVFPNTPFAVFVEGGRRPVPPTTVTIKQLVSRNMYTSDVSSVENNYRMARSEPNLHARMQ